MINDYEIILINIKYIMNSEPSIRTISVKYTVVFCVIIGFLFLFS